MIELLFKLLVGHAFADFAFQSDAIAKGKNKNNKTVPPVGQKYVPCWPYYLTAHTLIHSGMVYLITNSLGFALFEFVSHWAIDYCKCDNKLTVHQDQALHLACKLIIVAGSIL
jgi:hypothetical protein